MNTMTIKIFDQFGRESDYIPFAVRLPEFLSKYPLGEKYRLRSKQTDLLSDNPGLLELYKLCIQQSKDPKTMGLPPIMDCLGIVVTRTLVDEAGNEIASAKATEYGLEPKVQERCETAAMQRLISLLGFPGDPSFLDDELSGLEKRGITAEVATGNASDNTVSDLDDGHMGESVGALADADNSSKSKQEESGPSEEKAETTSSAGKVPVHLLRQIRAYTQKRGLPEEEIPDFTSAEEARLYLGKLTNGEVSKSAAAK